MRKLTVLILVSLMLCAVGASPNCTETQTEMTETTWENFSHDRVLTKAEIIFMADKFERRDHEGFPELSDVQIEQLKNAFVEKGILPEEEDEVAPPPLPDCGGYWGAHHEVERIEHNGSENGLKYQVGPNCAMRAPGTDCGSDDDYMLSFYFGRHDESLSQLMPKLRWDSESERAEFLLWISWNWVLSARVYEQHYGGGVDNYNIYICTPSQVGKYLSTFWLRKY